MTAARFGVNDFTLAWEDPAGTDLATVNIGYKEDSQPDFMEETVLPGVQNWTKTGLDFIAGDRFTISLTAIGKSGQQTTVSFKVTLTADLKDYYFIYTPADLNAIRGGDTSDTKYAGWDSNAEGFVLMEDINLSVFASGEGWVPIGDYNTTDTSFAKTFEGNGHVISGLVINRPAGNYQGLFGLINTDGIVRDVGVQGSVSGLNNCGLLAGNNEGLIDNSHSSGDVTGTSADAEGNTGGLAGYNNGTISNSYSSSNVTVDAPNGGAGGLVGLNNTGTISGCHASGTVTGGTEYCAAGGLAGCNQDGGTIIGSYATGNVSGENAVGGLLGLMPTGNLSDSHATGNVSGTGENIGGLVGGTTGSTITDCYYSTGTVTNSSGVKNAGGLVGYMSSTDITGSHATGNVNGKANAGGLVGYFLSGTVTNCYATGAVTGSYGVGGLFGFMDGGTASNCHATGNVSTSFDRAGGLAGINDGGTISDSYASGIVVAANNHAGGLVGINLSGSISGCHASGAVTAGNDVGGLVGENTASISLSYATGAVTGSYTEIGGFAGLNSGTITLSYATGSATRTGTGTNTDNVGGFVGFCDGGTITNCYARGSASGFGSIGGFAGRLNNSSVSYCYSTGLVTGTNYAGGLVGYIDNGTAPSYCYYDQQTSGGWADSNGTPTTTANMKLQVTFTGWDFAGETVNGTNNYWSIGTLNDGYPYLTNNTPTN